MPTEPLGRWAEPPEFAVIVRRSTRRAGLPRDCEDDVAQEVRLRSGTPVTRYGYSDAYGRYEFFLTNRGGDGRTPDNYEADVHLGYPLKTGPARVNLILDVFNILNAQRPVLLDERWGFQESDDALAASPNPNYLKAALRTAPTSARLGVRVSF